MAASRSGPDSGSLPELVDDRGLLQYALRLGDDLLPDRCRGDLAGGTLEQGKAQFILEPLDCHAQGRLGHETGGSGAGEMALPGEGDDVAQFGQGHWQAPQDMQTRKLKQKQSIQTLA